MSSDQKRKLFWDTPLLFGVSTNDFSLLMIDFRWMGPFLLFETMLSLNTQHGRSQPRWAIRESERYSDHITFGFCRIQLKKTEKYRNERLIQGGRIGVLVSTAFASEPSAISRRLIEIVTPKACPITEPGDLGVRRAGDNTSKKESRAEVQTQCCKHIHITMVKLLLANSA